MSEARKPVGAERRREERTPQTGELRFHPGVTINGSPERRAQLVNCSVHGIGMNCDQPLLLGSDFVIVSNAYGPLIYKVRCCFEINSGYFIGAETDQPIAETASAVASLLAS